MQWENRFRKHGLACLRKALIDGNFGRPTGSFRYRHASHVLYPLHDVLALKKYEIVRPTDHIPKN